MAVRGGVCLGLVELALLLLRPVVNVSLPDAVGLGVRLVAIDVALCVLVVGVVTALARLARVRSAEGSWRVDRTAAVVWATVTPAAWFALWLLTAGRRLATSSLRPWGVGLAGILVGAAVAFVVRAWLKWVPGAPWNARMTVAAGCAVAAVVLLFADLLWLPRLYFPLHATLAVIGVGLWLAAFVSLPPVARDVRWVPPATALALLAAPVLLVALARGWDTHAGFVVEGSGVISGKLVRAVGAFGPAPAKVAAEAVPRAKAAKAPAEIAVTDRNVLNLQGHDVLLITIDALRADRLRAYGGNGLTPAMDALAAEGFVFRRAYTPTPSTSYALTSLLAATCVRTAFEASPAPVFAFAAERLQRAGYRTAAFYPPAVFHVDGPRFDAMRAAGLGFGTHTEGLGTGTERVSEVRSYLASVPASSRVFVWTHLLEPHEPYETHGRVPADSSAEARYDAEVAAVDHAVGELVRLFRAARPRCTIVVTADHGEEFGDHGGYYHGTTVYDEQVRVPLLWWSSEGIAAGGTATPVNLTDIMTTLLPALGVPPSVAMRGRNLGTAFADPSMLGPTFTTAGERFAVMDGRRKLVGETGRPGGLLFDLDADPGERADLARDEPAAVAVLAEAFGALRGAMVPPARANDAYAAAFARARVGDGSAAKEVMAALGDDSGDIRRGAARAAGDLRSPEFTQVLARLRGMDELPAVQREATLAGVLVGDADAMRALRTMSKAILADADAEFLERRAFVLAEGQAPGGEAALRAVAADETRDDGVRRRAILALGVVRDRRAVPVLLKLLPDDDLRVAVAQALTQVGDRRARPALARALAVETYAAGREALTAAMVALGGTVPAPSKAAP